VAAYIGRVLVDVCVTLFGSSTPEECEIHTSTRTLPIYAATITTDLITYQCTILTVLTKCNFSKDG